MIEFKEFPKIPRLKREVVVTEKLDGTNACVVIDDDGTVAAQSRSRLITPTADNYGFAAWVEANKEELKQLGPGYHYGEWWGQGIQRRYGLLEKRFSLFNVGRWSDRHTVVGDLVPKVEYAPSCCHVVPIILRGEMATVDAALNLLRESGSYAAPGFMNPEGVIVYHSASRAYFKVLLENDSEPKGKAA